MGPDITPTAVAARRPGPLADPAPRPAEFYDPTTPPYRDEQGVHLFDHRTIRSLLRNPERVTADVSELLTPGLRTQLHPVSCFVWATDRRTLRGCPGRHAALRSVMAPWLAAAEARARQVAARLTCDGIAARLAGRPFDVYLDYALPVAVGYLADWLGVDPAHVVYAMDDQIGAGNMFDAWPPLAPPGMDDRYRTLMARSDLRGVAAAVQELLRPGVLAEREAWGIVYSLSVSGVATATTIALTVGLGIEHDLWHRMADATYVGAAVEEAVRLGNPFPQSSRFARESFVVGDVVVEPREQVLMWLTAANRDLPGEHRQPLDRFDPERDTSQHVGWGSGYHLCGGVHHARALTATAVTSLARRCPELGIALPWARFVGIDDGYTAAPVVPLRTERRASDGPGSGRRPTM